ncbi:hypothetical protein MRB53_041706 [Persea americana]|nr:hypothetical protein MRB53_041706 [Persea americana]
MSFHLLLIATLIASVWCWSPDGQSILQTTIKHDLHLTHDLFALHKNLTNIESISGNEQAVGEWLSASLESQGYHVEKQILAKDPLRFNVLAWPGKNRDARLILSSHIDTVPPFYPYKRNSTGISGRGAVDAKGSVATQIIAVNNLLSSGDISPDDVALLYVIGEEVGGDGMRAANDLGLKPQSIIFGEPTEGKLVSGHKGNLGIKLTAKGKAAHSGYPWLGLSATEILLESLIAIARLGGQLPESDKYGATTINIGRVDGGVAGNVVAESATALIAVRIAAGTPAFIKKEFIKAIHHAIRHFLEGGLELEDLIDMSYESAGYPPVDIDHDVPGFEVMTVNYGTDIPNFNKTVENQKRYLYGPGSIFVAHSDHELLTEKDLISAVDGVKIDFTLLATNFSDRSRCVNHKHRGGQIAIQRNFHMDDEAIGTFCSFTSGTPEQAQRYLALTDGNVEQAVELFFTSPDLGNTAIAAQPNTRDRSNRDNPITIDDDDEENEDGAQDVSSRRNHYEDDEAIARRMQEEMYGGAGAGQEEQIRAPMARTTETLVGPGSNWQDDPNEMRAAIAEQMAARQRRRAAPGIFNQNGSASIWNDNNPGDPDAHRRALSRATGGASDQTAKSNLLADLFRPPFDLIAHLSLADARDEGKENEKWILVNVQDSSIFDCQVLNRDIWKNQSIRDTIKEHFIFLQYQKDDPRAEEYINYYFSNMKDHEDAYPHIAIIDPRTGEQVKTWSGTPAPKASDFLMELHEFLDRYSLNMSSKNPVQAKRKEKQKDVTQMSEEEMLHMALQNSMDAGPSNIGKEVDPDSLTKPNAESSGSSTLGPDMMDVEPSEETTKNSVFAQISTSNVHEEPVSLPPAEVTRIQFRYSGGRVVRRFKLDDSVLRIYEWLKASPLEGT